MREIGGESFGKAYGKSMKPRGMDGPIDLFLYRPVGFALARLFSFTSLKPNAVTFLSALAGAAAGAVASAGTPGAFLLCALLFQLANFLDCADGQLARLTGRYSEEGRLYDGMADYCVNVCVALGCILGLSKSGQSLPLIVALVVSGSLGMGLSCMLYDRAINRYREAMEGFGEDELETSLERARLSAGFKRLMWSVYAGYLRLQGKRGPGAASRQAALRLDSEAARKSYAEGLQSLLAAWSFTGPSAHVLYFLACVLAGRVEVYFVLSVLIGLLSVVFVGLQQLVDQRLLAGLPEESPRT